MGIGGGLEAVEGVVAELRLGSPCTVLLHGITHAVVDPAQRAVFRKLLEVQAVQQIIVVGGHVTVGVFAGAHFAGIGMGLRQRTAAGLSVGHLPTDWNRQATALVPPALPERLGWRADRLLLTKEEYRETNADGVRGSSASSWIELSFVAAFRPNSAREAETQPYHWLALSATAQQWKGDPYPGCKEHQSIWT